MTARADRDRKRQGICDLLEVRIHQLPRQQGIGRDE